MNTIKSYLIIALSLISLLLLLKETGFIIWLSIISLYLIIENGIILFKQIRKIECPSVFPFVGGICGALAVLLAFDKQYWGMIFIPLLLDYGSIPIICKCIFLFITDWVNWWSKNRKQ